MKVASRLILASLAVSTVLLACKPRDGTPPASNATSTVGISPTPFFEAGLVGDTAVIVGQRLETGRLRIAAYRVPPSQGEPPRPGEVGNWIKRHRPVSAFESASPYEEWTAINGAAWAQEGSTYFGFGVTHGVAPADFKKSRVDALLPSAVTVNSKPHLYMTLWSPDGRWCCSVFMTAGRSTGHSDLFLGSGSTEAGGDMYVALADTYAEHAVKVWRLVPPYEWYVPGIASWSDDSRFFSLFADHKGRTVVWVLPVPEEPLKDAREGDHK